MRCDRQRLEAGRGVPACDSEATMKLTTVTGYVLHRCDLCAEIYLSLFPCEVVPIVTVT